jgi:hypothetical protein
MSLRLEEEAIQQAQQPSTSAQSLASQSFSTPSSSSASSPYIPPRPTDVSFIDVSCPDPPVTGWDNKHYNCTKLSGIQGSDLTGISAYSIQQCIDACSTYNSIAGEDKCKAVVLNRNLKNMYTENKGGNCWLKSDVKPVEALLETYDTTGSMFVAEVNKKH